MTYTFVLNHLMAPISVEQIMEYNILDFSEWKDDSKFEGMFRKLIDGLELFYKGRTIYVFNSLF